MSQREWGDMQSLGDVAEINLTTLALVSVWSRTSTEKCWNDDWHM